MSPAVPRGLCLVSAHILVACLCRPALAEPVRMYLFDVNPSHAYRFQVNGADVESPVSGPAGSVVVTLDVANGDIVQVVDDGNTDLQPPSPPVFSTLATGDAGCAVATWVPSGDPTVVGYVVSWGSSPSLYDQSVTVAAGSAVQVCSLQKGTHYFAVQSRNYQGMLSAYSVERSVEIVVVSALIAGFDARIAGDTVLLTWNVSASGPLLGFAIYRTGPDGTAQAITADLLPPAEKSYVDASVVPGTRYTYTLVAVDEAGEETRSAPLAVETPALVLELGQNIPNPFNPVTTLPFVLDTGSRVAIRIYDVRGALVTTLFEGALPEGSHRIRWDGRDSAGRSVASGAYIAVLVSGNRQISRKMLLVR